MNSKLPLVLAILSVAAVSFLVLSRGWQTVSRQVEPREGRECFEMHRPVLPVGSQYEGFEATEAGVRTKVMTGLGMREVECVIGPNGSLEPARGR